MKMTVTSPAIFDQVRPVLQTAVSGATLNNLAVMLREGEVTVSFDDIDPTNCRWDGTVYVNWTTVPTAERVLNYVVGRCRADEVSMVTNSTLRLWFD